MLRGSVRPLAWLIAGVVVGVFATELMRPGRLRHLVSPPAEPTIVERGRTNFSGIADIDGGLGPAFNARSCVTCHYLPEAGGSGTQAVMHVAVGGAAGDHTLFALSSIDDHRCQPRLPVIARVARRMSAPLFGAGLVDALPDAAIRMLADPDDRDGDGVSGRAAAVQDPATGAVRVGRFGWKAIDATLLSAVARSYAGEMGVTNRLFPNESHLGIDPDRLKECDTVADPEDVPDPDTGLTTIDRLTAFVGQLPPPRPRPLDDRAREGGRLFGAIGCAACHTPSVGSVAAYSDFLLHDVGTGDGIAQGDAQANEFRTAPLWGVGARRPFLHDGSAPSLESAIDRHAVEGRATRDRFAALPEGQRQALIAFLRSL